MYTKYNLTKVRYINKSNNHQSPQIIEHTQINTTNSDKNLDHGMGQAHKYGGGKTGNWAPNLPLL